MQTGNEDITPVSRMDAAARMVPLQFGRLAIVAVALLTPTVVAGGLAYVSDGLAPLALAGLIVLSLAVVAAVLWQQVRDLRAVAGYVETILHAEHSVPVPETGSMVTRYITLSLARGHRTWRRQIDRLTAELTEASDIIEALSQPIFLLDRDGRVTRSNMAARSLFGARLAGRDIATLVRHPDLLTAVTAVTQNGTAQMVEFTLRGPVERVLEARVSPFGSGDGEDGQGRSIVVSFHDITALRRADQMRADFIANASHELRTPLSSLIGYLETLRGPAHDDEVVRDRFLGIMHEQAQRMSRLVHDLLSLSRIEQVEHTPPTEPVDLLTVIEHVTDVLAFKAQERGVALEIHCAGKPTLVAGDEDQLTQLTQNLVDNAIKYGARDLPVTITLEVVDSRSVGLGGGPDDRALALRVRDRGEGIARDHLPRLTERFYRIDPARSRAVGGTGLGLAVVKHIVNRHRGRLAIDSEAGKGSTFSVFLPLWQAPLHSRLA
jgi:two-component system, OmpR family, phosphate regulon sensor histidine kinase PhoR